MKDFFRSKRTVWIPIMLLIAAVTIIVVFACSTAAARNETTLNAIDAEQGPVEEPLISDDCQEFSSDSDVSAETFVCPQARVSIFPDHNGEGRPGETLNYPHVVENQGNMADTFNITYTSSLGWEYMFFSDPNGDGDPSDGEELIDTNGDGIIDTGEVCKNHMGENCKKEIVKQVVIPETAVPGQVDTMVITATSTQALQIPDECRTENDEEDDQDSAANVTTVRPPIPTPSKGGVLPFTGAVLLPIILLGAVLLCSGTGISHRGRTD